LKPIRLVVASITIPVLIAYLYFLPPYPYFLVLLVGAGVVALHEFSVMYKVPRVLVIPGVSAGGVLLYIACLHTAYFVDALFLSLSLLLFLRIIAIRTPSGSMSDIGPLAVGFLYICGFLSFHWFLRTETFGLEYIFLLYTSVWIADAMAYYVGTFIGRNRLSPSISPNKTYEGALGSLLGGAAGAGIIFFIFDMPDMTAMMTVMIGAALGAVTVLGDLIESMFKRDAGVKDSSSLIPGHGGLLDKIDGLLIAGPLFYFILRYAQ
jgi:phosphatidate cytidylyltransferase